MICMHRPRATAASAFLVFAVLVNGAATKDINSFISIYGDTNTISALLQEEASGGQCDCGTARSRSRGGTDKV